MIDIRVRGKAGKESLARGGHLARKKVQGGERNTCGKGLLFGEGRQSGGSYISKGAWLGKGSCLGTEMHSGESLGGRRRH